MSFVVAFIVRLVGYALLVGIPARVAEYFWQRAALDRSDMLQPLHDVATAVVTVVPVVLALFGFGRLRNVAVFVALFLVGAALTAPFAFARLAPTG